MMHRVRSSRWRGRLSVPLLGGVLALLLLLLGLARADGEAVSATATAGQSTSVAVYGPDGCQLLLDGRVAGQLPLSVPLAISPGKHQLRLKDGHQAVDAEIDARPHRPLEVRFTLQPPLAVVTPTFGAVLIADYGGVAAPAEQALAQAVVSGAAAERVLVLPPEELAAPLAATPGLADCLKTIDCQERLATLVEAHFVLLLRIEAAPKDSGGSKHAASSSWRFWVTLHDVPAGETSATAKVECASCTLPAASQRLSDLASQVVRDGASRAEGALEITTVPASAKVVIDGRDRGPAPLHRTALAGRHEVRVEAPGYLAQSTEVPVLGERTASLQVTLVPNQAVELVPRYKPSEVAQPAPRSWLRQPGKWVAAALGIGELMAAGALWGLDGYQSCPKADLGHCHYELDTRNTGIGLFIGGGITIGVTGLLFYLDARSAHLGKSMEVRLRSSSLSRVSQ